MAFICEYCRLIFVFNMHVVYCLFFLRCRCNVNGGRLTQSTSSFLKQNLASFRSFCGFFWIFLNKKICQESSDFCAFRVDTLRDIEPYVE